jgi:hypothetical protein
MSQPSLIRLADPAAQTGILPARDITQGFSSRSHLHRPTARTPTTSLLVLTTSNRAHVVMRRPAAAASAAPQPGAGRRITVAVLRSSDHRMRLGDRRLVPLLPDILLILRSVRFRGRGLRPS